MTLFKKIIKKPILWIALALLAIFIFLYITGFRITYAPNLKNDWDAISGSAAWASVLLSFAAICAAIYVPYKVANDQNKISLFEKRYAVYIQLEKCVIYGDILKFNLGNIGPKTIDFLFLKTFLDDTIGLKDIAQDRIDKLFYDVWNKIKQSEFLFDKKSSDEIVALSKALFDLMASLDRENNVEEKAEIYATQSEIIKEKIMPHIREQLKLD